MVDLLRKSEAFISQLSLVAIVDDQIVGYILFSKIYIVDEQGNRTPSIALAPVAVLPQFQKQGIGTQLIERGLSDARVLNFKSAVVLGHPTYYPKFGFVKAEKWSIKAPFDVPSEAFMAIELVENTLQGIAGTVEYPKEFQEVS